MVWAFKFRYFRGPLCHGLIGPTLRTPLNAFLLTCDFVLISNPLFLKNATMQDQNMAQLLSKEKSTPKSKRKKSSIQTAQMPSKRDVLNESLTSLPDLSENDYRDLRRKYLILEEESFGLGNELKSVEDEIKGLEEEKVGLLDELVVLEGLIDPSDMDSKGRH